MNNNSNDEVQGHSTLQTILLHLVPGAIATTLFVLTVHLANTLGYPSIVAFYLPMILTVIIVELGYLLIQSRKGGGNPSLKEVINYREPAPGWQYVVFPILILAGALS